ncbi:hypothetical protein KSP40_PGU007846 [Platanthera guangdongensis]|uniref:Uncharacterized protein n=1 Tax=Platanthera guangdongensis TaxID=2320717 RepID=A0ABR2MWY4_9ASPA
MFPRGFIQRRVAGVGFRAEKKDRVVGRGRISARHRCVCSFALRERKAAATQEGKADPRHERMIADLHQNTAVGSTDITDTWEPLEEGLLPHETTRHVLMIKRYWLSQAINLEVKSQVAMRDFVYMFYYVKSMKNYSFVGSGMNS